MATLPQEPIVDRRDALTGLADLSTARTTIARWQADWPADTIACPVHAMLITLGRIDTVNVAFGELAGDGALVDLPVGSLRRGGRLASRQPQRRRFARRTRYSGALERGLSLGLNL